MMEIYAKITLLKYYIMFAYVMQITCALDCFKINKQRGVYYIIIGDQRYYLTYRVRM